MPRRAEVVEPDVLAELGRGGVARVADLVVLGVGRSTVAHRCRQGGPWQRLLPGVILLSNGAPTRSQLRRAALSYAGPGALLTGPDAVCLHGLREPRSATGAVHLLMPTARRRTGAGCVLVERTDRVPLPVIRSGLPVAPVPRAVLDTARRLTDRDDVRALLAEAVQRGRCKPAELRREIDSGSGRGSALPRSVLREIEDGVRSVAEADARQLVLRSGLPAPIHNARLTDADGAFLAVVDSWFDAVGLAWEIDSYEFHLGPADYARTLERHALLTAHGVVVLHTLPSRLRRQPAVVLSELQATFHQAALRPRPTVRAAPS
ncbi:MAG: hypothetical protein H0W01_15415 [Pseudonocardiales bacterium]|nr:hypothetical protein [Pseudonocardiales bacterium]